MAKIKLNGTIVSLARFAEKKEEKRNKRGFLSGRC